MCRSTCTHTHTDAHARACEKEILNPIIIIFTVESLLDQVRKVGQWNFGFYLLFIYLYSQSRVSLYSPSYPRTFYVDQAGPDSWIHLLCLPMPRLKACVIIDNEI
uniref:Uncharacterized protein n=1 Tax=Mus musculus TaxID=10090 RepID=Q8BNF9_MOUSE|nr:unnamed protein product [Mus musculus]